MSERSSVLAIVATGVLLGVLFYALIVDADGLGINLVLVQMVFVVAVTVLARRTGHAFRRVAWVAAAFSLMFAATFALYASPLGHAVAGVGFLVSQAVFVLYVIGHHADFHHPLQFLYSAFLVIPIRAMTRVSIFCHVLPQGSRLPSSASPIFIGLGILIPLLIVFEALFASADPLFEQYISGMFDVISLPSWISHMFGTAFWSVAFVAVLGLSFWRRVAFKPHMRPDQSGHTESVVVLGGVIILFATFLIVQASYLFGGEAAFQATDYTFSEYARRGFDELVAVATIVILLFLSLRFFHGDRATHVLRALHGVLFGETLLVLISAIVRMNLYVDAYGYTTARLFTYWFLAVVAALLALAFIHLIRDIAQPRFVRQGLVLVGVFALTFVLSAPDAMSFRLNTDRILTQGSVNQIDVYNASAEAYDMLVRLEQDGVAIEDGDVNASPFDLPFGSYYHRGNWRTWNWAKSRIDPAQPFPWLGCVTEACLKIQSDQ